LAAASGKEPTVGNLDLITERVTRYVEATRIPALALGIVRDGKLVYAMGFGSEVTADTLFPSCSTAKPITAMVVMKLFEDGFLDLDQPVVEYLPDLALPNDRDAGVITLRQLLSHTSGLSPDPDVPSRVFGPAATALRDHVFQDIPGYAALPAGEVLWYSNPGFNLAGCLAADRTGQVFPSLVEEVVLQPLSMSRTTFDSGSPLANESNTALPAAFRGKGPPVPYPAGGAVTTVRDLSRLAVCLLSGGGNLLSPSTVSLMHTVHADAYTRPPRQYGLGFDIEEHRGRKLVTHGGGGFGCGSTFALLPDEMVGVIVLFNHPAGHAVRACDIIDDVLSYALTKEESRNPASEFSTGTFHAPIPHAAGYPPTITITAESGRPLLVRDGRRLSLNLIDDGVFVTADERVSVGFVPGGDYAILDTDGLGLVSAIPYQRVR
jgi:CubicO group peptidase (beta-lactamase class C family)